MKSIYLIEATLVTVTDDFARVNREFERMLSRVDAKAIRYRTHHLGEEELFGEVKERKRRKHADRS